MQEPSRHTPIHIWHPHIGDTPITDKDQLHHLINDQYPGLTRNPHFLLLLTDAETHLALIAQLRNQRDLQRGDRTHLARQVGVKRQLVTAYIQDARKPRLYYLIEHSLAKSEAHAKLEAILRGNNGIRSIDDLGHRLATYYLTPFHEKSPQHQRRLAQCNTYFAALEMLKDGGCYIDAARALRVHHSQVSRWLSEHRPDLVDLARRIPDQFPAPENRWLPLGIDQAFHPTDFVQVPNRITNHVKIRGVLNQLRSLDNTKMKQYVERFGPASKEDAFYYLLGLIVSDFEKNRPRTSSTELTLNLSKNYPWSEQVGEAACYYLGQLGIHADKARDRDSSAGPKTCYSWRSQKTPLITWVTRACLGLQENECTTYHAIKASWLLGASGKARTAFLQGLNDGDGWASTKDQCIGNACGPNICFLKDLLSTFNIDATDDGLRVRIRSQVGIVRAAELPFFRHAADRQTDAEKLADMMRTRQQQVSGILSREIVDVMAKLRDKGLSYGAIAEEIYDQFSISLDHRVVAQRIRSRKQTSKNK